MKLSGFFKRAPVLCAAIWFWSGVYGETTQTLMLSGAGNDDSVIWRFKVSGGRKGGIWSNIAVPSNWEMQGFGTYRYWRDWTDPPAPDSVGLYRHWFTVPEPWRGKKVDIVFGGSMTDTEVKVNGIIAGLEHRGGFYEFRYDVSGLLRYGRQNRIEVRVRKFSADASINRAERKADFWLFGGIFRPVWLEAFPVPYIERVAIDARHTGEFSADVFTSGVTMAGRVSGRIFEMDGRPAGQCFFLSIDSTGDLRSINLDLRSRKLDLRSSKLDLRSRNLDLRSSKLDLRSRNLDLRSTRDLRSRNLDLRSSKLDLRSTGDFRSRKLDLRSTNDGGKITLRAKIEGIRPWSAEFPNRYRARIRLEEKGRVLHEVTVPFGFRTVETRLHDGLYVNGTRVLLKGVNRHSFWPSSGRTTSRKISDADAALMKDMNMNAVRCSHYPPDSHFLDVADSLGLYVIDELTGWQAAYDTEPGRKLVRELVLRDANHPSIILWANGNEGGFNTDLDGEYAAWDVQKRTVIHPWQNFNGINTAHYESYDCCPGTFFHGSDIIMPTEFLHGLYDGGGGAGLEDWWNLMIRHRLAAGGFLWALLDEGIVRADRNGAVDTDGNHGPDGVLGPYREKEGSFFAVRKIWSPVAFDLDDLDRLPPLFAGALCVENRYDFTNLNEVRFTWKLVDFPSPASGDTGYSVATEGVVDPPDVRPHGVDSLHISLPSGWREHDALTVSAADPRGRETASWTWMIPCPETVAGRVVKTGPGKAVCETTGGLYVLKAAGTEIEIDTTAGLLVRAMHHGREFPLKNGPRPVQGGAGPVKVRHYFEGSNEVVEAKYDGAMRSVRWQLAPDGWLRLDYAYAMPGHSMADYLGITFDYAEEGVTGMRWLGRGPYRVWKNRMKGADFSVWHKRYNDAVTGYRWEYPEFKGFHAGLYWAVLESDSTPVTMVFASDGLFLRLFTPKEPEGALFSPQTAHVDFPPGDLSFLHGIAPIGTKFHPAKDHGPQGQPNMVPRLGKLYEGTVYFYFGNEK